MKNFLWITLLIPVILASCTTDEDDTTSQAPEYAMTAKINGETFQANDPFGTQMYASTNIYNYYPIDDFVLLQGRQGGTFGNPEINLWLKRSDIAVGSYTIGKETFDTPPSHFIDLIDNSNTISEHTKQGTVIITAVNTADKIVTGTFEFTTIDDLDDPMASIDYTITEGTFYYQYE